MSNNSKYFMAIDPSISCTGFCVMDIETRAIPSYGYIHAPLKKNGFHTQNERVDYIIKTLLKPAVKYSVKDIAIEGYSFGNNNQAYKASLHEVVGIMKYIICHQTLGKEPIIIAPKRVKKLVTGNGNASKEFVRDVVSGLYPDIILSNQQNKAEQDRLLNISDAIAIALAYLAQ